MKYVSKYSWYTHNMQKNIFKNKSLYTFLGLMFISQNPHQLGGKLLYTVDPQHVSHLGKKIGADVYK